MTCQRTYAKTKNQIMANLPASRVTLAVPFSRVDIDLAGPVFVRRRHTRKLTFDKAYIGVIVCLSTKAVHLELFQVLHFWLLFDDTWLDKVTLQKFIPIMAPIL